MNAHVNGQLIRKSGLVAPSYFPKTMLSGLDLVFFIRIDEYTTAPVFVQIKLHQGSTTFSKKDWNDAISTVSATGTESRANDSRDFCPDKVYIS